MGIPKVIPKAELVHGVNYIGHCRHAWVALWNGKDQQFVYLRQKFGGYLVEGIPHIDDAGPTEDGFEPWQVVNVVKIMRDAGAFDNEPKDSIGE